MQSIGHMASDFSVEGRLERTLGAAIATVDARCAAIVLNRVEDGSVQRVVISSDDPADIAALESVIGAAEDGAIAATGFPVLVVPLETENGQRSGTLYTIGRSRPARDFSADDQMLVASLANTAGVAVACATAHEQARYRGDWLSALASVSLQIMQPDHHPVQVAQDIAELVLGLTGAKMVTVEVPDPDDPDMLEVRVAAGTNADQLVGTRYPKRGSVEDVAMASGSGRRWLRDDSPPNCSHTASAQEPIGEVMAAPLRGDEASRGVVVASTGIEGPGFRDSDLHMLQDFARQVVLALEVSESRRVHEQLRLVQEREQLANALQDNVIQRLFGLGLQLQTLNRNRLHLPEIDHVLEGIDESIRQVRAALTS